MGLWTGSRVFHDQSPTMMDTCRLCIASNLVANILSLLRAQNLLQLLLPDNNLQSNTRHTTYISKTTPARRREPISPAVWFTERVGIVFHSDFSRGFLELAPDTLRTCRTAPDIHAKKLQTGLLLYFRRFHRIIGVIVVLSGIRYVAVSEIPC